MVLSELKFNVSLCIHLASLQSLKVKDNKPPLVHCVTDGCKGYITLLAWFEGPLGQETTKYYHFQANQVQHGLQ